MVATNTNPKMGEPIGSRDMATVLHNYSIPASSTTGAIMQGMRLNEFVTEQHDCGNFVLAGMHSHVHHARLPALVLGNLLRHHALPPIFVGLRNLCLKVDDSLGWIQAFGAAVGAVHDAMAAVELHSVVDPCQPLLCELVPRVSDPAVCLHQHGRAEVVLRIPPVGWAGRHAASAEDALVHAVELGTVILALEVLLVPLLLHVLPLQPGFDGLVLVIEVREVGHQVLDDVRMGQRLYLDGLVARLNVQQACEAVLAVDVHGTRAADALAARAAEGQGGVHLVLDLDEGVQDHGSARLEVDGVLLQIGLGHLVRVVAVDAELLRRSHLRSGRCKGPGTWHMGGEPRPEGARSSCQHCRYFLKGRTEAC
mmetsp:Transcript_111121/g.270035  ORF Transcript_111121/g.270035 Transcript_111121/m.270035 type:complete len:367 (-) Transcript_111121:38-1138(-)